MKFTLNITDMNEEEFNRVFQQINTPLDTDIVVKPHKVEVSNSDTPQPDVDADGLKWDARIHSSNHQLTAKGVWQRRRGISDEEFNAVKNELLGVTTPVAPVVAHEPTPLSPELVAVNHTLYTTAEDLARVAPVVAPAPLAVEPTPVAPVAQPAPTPQIDSAVLNNTMIEKLKAGLANGTVKANDIQDIINAINVQFNMQYQSLAQVKDNIPVLQFVVDRLVSRGL